MKTITHVQHWKDYTSYYIMTANGLGMVRITDTGDEQEISDLYVDEYERNKGIGTQLLDAAIKLCKTVRLHGKIVVMTNYNSEPWVAEWYIRLGFVFERIQSPLNAVFDDDDGCKVYSMSF